VKVTTPGITVVTLFKVKVVAFIVKGSATLNICSNCLLKLTPVALLNGSVTVTVGATAVGEIHT
jgi:hypothetical protein